MNIMFVCKHNIFRSRVAEEYMKRISNHNVSSAGVVRISGDIMPAIEKEVCDEFDLILPNQSKTLSAENLQKQDLVIIVADDVPQEIFEHPLYNLKDKIRKWGIEDTQDNSSKEDVRGIIKEIMRKVDELNEEFRTER